jgi:hypothetical protein
MNSKQMTEIVADLNRKAADTSDATEALKFSQAALNAANSFCALTEAKQGHYQFTGDKE